MIRHSKLILTTVFQPQDADFDLLALVIIGMKDRIVDADYTLNTFKDRRNVEIFSYGYLDHSAFAEMDTEILDHIGNFVKRCEEARL